MGKKTVFTILLPLICLAGLFFWYREGLLPVDKYDTNGEDFIVRPGESINTIARNLEAGGFIRNRIVFYLVIKQLGIEKSIQYGDFRLRRDMSTTEVAQELTHGMVDVWVTIIEGLRKEEVGEALASKIPISTERFDELAHEGYLFPDTYLIPKDASEETMVGILEKTFDQKVKPLYLSSPMRTVHSLNEIVTLASIVEREARTAEDKRKVARALWNRIAIDMPLQVDATIQYALGYIPQEKDWWKEHLTNADLQLDTEFNTYRYSGLPPQPISNPGLEAIQAVLNPASGDYLYYISGKDGVMHYANDLETHNKNIREYLN